MKSLTEEERQNLKEEKARYKKIIVDTLADKLSDFVEEKKKKEGITNNEMADLMKIEQGQLSKVLNSGTELGISSLVRIAKYFNVSTDYLLGLSYLQSTDEQYKATHALTGLSDKAIEKLNNLLKETKNEIGLKEVAIDNTKTINYLLEAEDEYHILSIITDFLWRTYKTNDFFGQEIIEIVDNSGHINYFRVSDLYNGNLLELEKQLIKLKDNKDTENKTTNNKRKK